jgi:hypothetical protein
MRCNKEAMKPRAPSTPTKSTEKPEMKSGLPARRRSSAAIFALAMKKHQETLRRWAQQPPAENWPR